MDELATEFASWLPPELKAYVLEKRANAKGYQDIEAEDRLLTDPRMQKVWKLFANLPISNRTTAMTHFLELLLVAYLEAKENKMTADQFGKLKFLKEKVRRQTEKLIKTTRDIDELCSGPETKKLVLRSVMDGQNSFEKQITRIQENLLGQLDGYKRSNSRFTLFVPRAQLLEIYSIKKRAQSNYIEMFVSSIASALFKRQFGETHHASAEEVSWVVNGTPAEKNVTRTHQRDRARKRIRPKSEI